MLSAHGSAGKDRMKKIGIDSVCKHVYRRNCDVIDSAVTKGIPLLPYDFEEFEDDALADDFIASQTTVAAKWKSLRASGVVVEKSTRTFLDVGELRARCERRSSA